MKALKWLGVVVGVVVVPIAVMFVWGAALDREHEASVTEVHPAPPEEVFSIITDHEGAVAWRPGLARVELLEAVDGRARWLEESEFGPMEYEQVEATPPTRYVARIVDTSQGFGGTWTYELEPAGGDATRLTITENGWVESPLFRFLSVYVFGQDTTMRELQTALKAHLTDR